MSEEASQALLRADSQRNRAHILDAAERVLGATGDLAMAEVAGEAGVTRSTVYRHFNSRDGLLDALIMRMAAATVAELLADIETLPLEAALDLLALRIVELSTAHRELVMAAGPRIGELARTVIADDPFVAYLGRCRTRGELRSSLPDDWLAAAVRALCLAAVSPDGLLGPRYESDARRRAEILATTLRRVLI